MVHIMAIFKNNGYMKIRPYLDKLTELPRPKRIEVSKLLKRYAREAIKEYEKKWRNYLIKK